jgi:hypothetical protein
MELLHSLHLSDILLRNGIESFLCSFKSWQSFAQFCLTSSLNSIGFISCLLGYRCFCWYDLSDFLCCDSCRLDFSGFDFDFLRLGDELWLQSFELLTHGSYFILSLNQSVVTIGVSVFESLDFVSLDLE